MSKGARMGVELVLLGLFAAFACGFGCGYVVGRAVDFVDSVGEWDK